MFPVEPFEFWPEPIFGFEPTPSKPQDEEPATWQA